MSSAFTDDELQKLKPYTAPEKAALVTGRLYFPFLVCEAKCGENGLNTADRQNIHVARVAVNAIVQLYRTTSRSEVLDRRVLFFSISHNHTWANVYGHDALIEGDNTTFHGHPICSFNFANLDGKDGNLSYGFT